MPFIPQFSVECVAKYENNHTVRAWAQSPYEVIRWVSAA